MAACDWNLFLISKESLIAKWESFDMLFLEIVDILYDINETKTLENISVLFLWMKMNLKCCQKG